MRKQMEWVGKIDWSNIGAFFGAIGMTAGALWGFYKKVLDRHILKPLKENTELTREIAKELRPNGGTSLKDQVSKLDLTVTDIQRRLLVAEINNSQNKGIYRAIMSEIKLGHWIADKAGKITEAGTVMCSIMKRDERDLRELNWVAWIIEADRDHAQSEWLEAIHQERQFDIDFRVLLPDNFIQKIRMQGFQVKDVNGSFEGFIGTVTALGKPYPREYKTSDN